MEGALNLKFGGFLYGHMCSTQQNHLRVWTCHTTAVLSASRPPPLVTDVDSDGIIGINNDSMSEIHLQCIERPD